MKKTRKKIIITTLLCLVLALCTAAGLCTAVSASGTKTDMDTGDVTVKVSVGYSSGSIYQGKWVPVYVTVKNNTEKTLSGTISLEIKESPYYSYNSQSGTDSVEKSYSLAAGTEKTVEIPVYHNTLTEGVICTVKNGNKKLNVTTVTNNNGYYGPYVLSQPPLLIGYVTESGKESDAKSFEALGQAQLTNGSYIAVETLTPDRFPSSGTAMNSFDMIVIGNIDTSASSSFDGEQMKLIHRFLESGKPVIIGTGAKGGESLKGFSEYFANDTGSVCTVLAKEQREFASSAFSYLGKVSQSGFGSLVIFPREITFCSVTDPNFIVFGQGGIYRHKDLQLYVTAFNFADFDKIKAGGMAEYVVGEVLNSSSSLQSMGSRSNMDQRFLYVDTKDRSPSGLTILFFMLAYIAVAVIGTFIFLTKRKKEKYMWVTTPVFAVIFTVLFLIYGVIYKGGDSVSSVKVIELSPDGRNAATVQTAVYASKGGNSTVSIDVEDPLYFNDGESDFFAIRSQNPEIKVRYGSENRVELRALKDSYVTAACAYTDTSYGTLEATLSMKEDNDLICRIVNNTGKKLTGAVVYYFGMPFYIGDIKAGEQIEKNLVTGKPSTYEYVLYKLCYDPAGFSEAQMGEDYITNDMASVYRVGYRYRNIKDSELFRSLVKEPELYRRAFLLRDLNGYLSSNYIYGSDKTGAILVCFDDSADIPVRFNGKKVRRTFSQTMLMSEVRADGDLSVPLDSLTLGVMTSQSMSDFYPDYQTGKVTFTPASYDQSYNYFVYLIKMPHAVTSACSELEVKLEFKDKKSAQYFAAYALNGSSGEFTPVLEGADSDAASFVLKLPASVVTNTGEYQSNYVKNGGRLMNDRLEVEASLVNSFYGKNGLSWVSVYDYRDFANCDVIPIVINCSASKLLKEYGEGNTVTAPVISGIVIDKTEVAFSYEGDRYYAVID